MSLMALIRSLLDVSLIASWIWLASESLPQPLPALGAALFGAASAGYWAFYNSLRPSRVRDEEDVSVRQDEVGRLTKFAARPGNEPAPARQDWFNNPELGRRMRVEAERCEKLSIPMSVIFMRTRPSSLADWSVGSPPRNLADLLPQLLDGTRQKYVTGAKGREAVIALIGGDRSAAEDIVQQLRRNLDSTECEAGIVVHPDEGVDPQAMVSIAKLRLRALGEADSGHLRGGPSDTQGQEEGLAAIPSTLSDKCDQPETAVS